MESYGRVHSAMKYKTIGATHVVVDSAGGVYVATRGTMMDVRHGDDTGLVRDITMMVVFTFR